MNFRKKNPLKCKMKILIIKILINNKTINYKLSKKKIKLIVNKTLYNKK